MASTTKSVKRAGKKDHNMDPIAEEFGVGIFGETASAGDLTIKLKKSEDDFN